MNELANKILIPSEEFLETFAYRHGEAGGGADVRGVENEDGEQDDDGEEAVRAVDSCEGRGTVHPYSHSRLDSVRGHPGTPASYRYYSSAAVDEDEMKGAAVVVDDAVVVVVATYIFYRPFQLHGMCRSN
ncbi:hypothetical protein TWF481_006620 [Arthrobotrys musiformis]|uniref:Uncharacterized protein n=1 Tax=Arthrobotrys musiformis TaxID=47236 RepID=A0AAV9WAZ4_9PEZI